MTILVGVGLVLMIVSMMDWYLSLPIVYVSALTKKCVRIEQVPLQKKRTCDDIVNNPEINYTQVWIK